MEMISAGIDTGLIRDVEAIAPLIGNTPLFPIRHLLRKPGVRLFAKLEWQQLGGSVKSRPAFNIIRRAVTDGLLTRDRILLDASSGNTGIAYAAIGAALGMKVSICIPENASEERKLLLRMYGAEVILTSRFGSTDEAQQIARELHAEYPERYFYADQYNNEANWRAHYRSTGCRGIPADWGKHNALRRRPGYDRHIHRHRATVQGGKSGHTADRPAARFGPARP
jgi:S-sulfo-L-cysteine synthase (O-acetyl-L-serine-dependent)